MSIAEIELPDGRIAEIEVPDGMDEQSLQSELQSLYASGAFDKATQAPTSPSNSKRDYYRALQSSLVGGLETGATIASGALAEPIAGLRGLAAAAIPGGQSGPEAIQSTRDSLRYEPRTERGREMLSSTGEALAPIGNAINSVESYLGDTVFEKTGSPTLAAAATSMPTLIAELLGAGAVKGTKAVSRARQAGKADDLIRDAAPSIDVLKDTSRGIYKEISDMGVVVKPQAYSALVGKIAKRTMDNGLDPRTTPAAAAALDRLMDAANGPVDLLEIEKLRKIAGGAAGKVTDKSESMLGTMIIDELDDFLDKSGVRALDNLPQGADIGKRYKAARDLWGRARRGELLQEAFYKAENQATGFENGLRNQFRSILGNKKQRRFFKQDELREMEKVVRGTATTNNLKRLGKLGFGEGAASNMLGGGLATSAGYAAGGPIGAAAVAATGTAARKGASIATQRAASMTDALVRSGKDARGIAQAYIRSTAKPDPQELAELLIKSDVDISKIQGVDEFTRRAMEIAAQRKAELVAASVAGSSERGTRENIIPFAVGQ
jgi:hypothetical protein